MKEYLDKESDEMAVQAAAVPASIENTVVDFSARAVEMAQKRGTNWESIPEQKREDLADIELARMVAGQLGTITQDMGKLSPSEVLTALESFNNNTEGLTGNDVLRAFVASVMTANSDEPITDPGTKELLLAAKNMLSSRAGASIVSPRVMHALEVGVWGKEAPLRWLHPKFQEKVAARLSQSAA